MSRTAIAADTDESPDKPSVKTLQMIWKEGADWKSVELLKRPNAGVVLNTAIPSVNGLQAYEHNYYTNEQFLNLNWSKVCFGWYRWI